MNQLINSRESSKFGVVAELADSLQRDCFGMPGSSIARSNRVLVVDEDQRTSQCLAELLHEDGFEVETARDGAAAIARLERGPVPGVLITELVVPHADGEAIMRYGRTLDPDLFMVAVTSYPQLLVPGRFPGRPPLVLTKPLDYGRLLELLEPPGRVIGAARSSILPGSGE